VKVDVQDLINFVSFANKMTAIDRAYQLKDTGRKENDAEHSYQLALVSWYLITKHKLPLNVGLCMSYSLVHDLVEIHAGDTFFYSDDSRAADKKTREAAALAEISKEFPDLPELTTLIHDYETRADEESVFVYALDKLLPVVSIYLNDGKPWQEERITLSMLQSKKVDKVALHGITKEYYTQLTKLLVDDELRLFGKTS
jgi:putative hydrolase of HD superfamily